MRSVSTLLLPLLMLLLSDASEQSRRSSGPEASPTIEVRLAPPKHPLPQVAAEIATLELKREVDERELSQELFRAFNASLRSATKRIGEAIQWTIRMTSSPSKNALPNTQGSRGTRGLSFLTRHDGQRHMPTLEGLSLRVHTVPASPPDVSLKRGIDNIEHKRAASEKAVFQQACAEMARLTNIVVNELVAQLAARVRTHAEGRSAAQRPRNSVPFLERHTPVAGVGLPRLVNVRIEASDEPFPRIAGLVQDMERRRDATEAAHKSLILELQTRLVKAENVLAQDALRSVISRITTSKH